MKKAFEWVKGMAGEALFWKAWEATVAGVRWLWRQTKAVVGLTLRVAAVTVFLVALSMAFLFAPRFLPVPNAWAETARGAIQGISAITGSAEAILSSNGGLFAFGQLFPGEYTDINRIATVGRDQCTRYTADQVPIKTGPGVVTGIFMETLVATTDDFILYDNTAASGTVLFQLTNMPATSSVGPIVIPFSGAFTTGLTLDVTLTAGSSVTVCYL